MNRIALVTRHLRRPLQPYQVILSATRPFSTFPGSNMPKYTGSCYCRAIEYELELSSPDEARTSLCHCRNCKVRMSLACSPVPLRQLEEKWEWRADPLFLQKAFGTNYGLTAKVPKDALRYTKGKTKEHVADNGSGALLHREFCDNCGSFILEYSVCDL